MSGKVEAVGYFSSIEILSVIHPNMETFIFTFSLPQGDSGGPLYARSEDGNITLVGVVSFGNGCARRSAPGVYVRISSYKNWLTRTIVNGSVTRKSATPVLNTWAIAGISVAGVVAVIIGGIIAIAVMRRRQKGPERLQEEQPDEEEDLSSPSRQPSTIPSMSGISN